MMMWAWLESVDIVGARGKTMIGLQGMITGMVGDRSVLVWSRNKTLAVA